MASLEKNTCPLALHSMHFEQTAQNQPKVLNRFVGAILSFFGQALKVEQADGKIGYVKISELKEKFIFCHLRGISKAEAKLARNDKIIDDLFLSTINPLKGTVVSKETLEKFSQKAFKYGLNYSSTDPKEIYSSIRKIRASIHSKDGMTTNQKKFIGNIQLGDIIFHRTDDTIHSDIVKVQSIAESIGLGCKHRDGKHHNHVYMCAKVDEFGKKWFAEAAWPSGKRDEIRLISEDDAARCFIKQDHGAISEIFRCTNPDLAKQAAEEACKVTTQLKPQENESTKEQPSQLRYSIMKGVHAIFASTSFGHFAKTRLFNWIRDTESGGMPTDFIRPNSFFCSYLVGYAFQMAEARPIVAKLVKEKQDNNSGTLTKLVKAHCFVLRHGRKLNQKMQFKFDSRNCTPGDLFSWLSEQKGLFTAVQSYQQPNNEKPA